MEGICIVQTIGKLQEELKTAVANNELFAYYQPQIEMTTGKIVGMEALLRWNNKQQEEIPPDVFIPLVEETGLIETIGDFVLDSVLAQQREWINKGYPPIPISINISPVQLQAKGFVEKVIRKIAQYKLSPEWIVLEITENVVMNLKAAIRSLWELNRFGVKLSIDDFGTGYSSLSYLKDLPFDILKIDRSFIKDIEHVETSMVITDTIINLASALGMSVVAEGVEKQEQAAILLESDCRVAQGFLYSPAIPAKSIEKMYFRA